MLRFADSIRQPGETDEAWPMRRLWILAVMILKELLGPEWVEKHIFSVNKHEEYLRGGYREELEDTELGYPRIVELAESLYNLQLTLGLDRVVKALRTDKVESAYAELLAARYLALNGTSFGFHPETVQGKPGENYDIDLRLPSGDDLCCEVECKFETTKFEPKTIEASLKHARRQLPASKPGMVFLKVPEGWIMDVEALNRTGAAIDAALVHTGRIAAVVVFGHMHVPLEGVIVRHLVHRKHLNPRSRFRHVIGDRLLADDVTSRPDRWLELSAFALAN